MKIRRTSIHRAKERARMSFFFFIMIFAVLTVIIITKFMLAELTKLTPEKRFQYDFQLQRGPVAFEESTPEVPINEIAEPATLPQDAVWQPVAGTRFKFYVYSAYVERRIQAAIRIIAATKTRVADNVACIITLTNNKTFSVMAKVKPIRENWNLKYSAAYVMCPLKAGRVMPDDAVGATVSVVSEMNKHYAPTNMLPVLDTKPKNDIDDIIHVCVKPFHYAYNRDDWLIEWLEMNRLLGVSHFYMYNVTIGQRVNCIINYYKSLNVITMLQWKLPITSKIEIRTEGQFAAFNDCLYRSMANAGWLLVIDMDELVFPSEEKNLLELLNLIHGNVRPVEAWIFRNAFFYMRWQDDPEAPNALQVSRKTRRWKVPHPAKNRSKYIVKPQQAVELGNHFIWEMVPGALVGGVPIEHAILHHYRMVCEFGGMQCLSAVSTVDRTAHRWANELQRKVDLVKNILKRECPE